MPIYEYRCEQCGYIFEEVATKMGPTNCPKCSALVTVKSVKNAENGDK